MSATVPRALYLAERENANAWREMAISLAATLKQPVVMPSTPANPVKKSPIAEAIQRESGGDPRLAGYFRKRVTELRKEGKTDGDIVELLGKWSTTEET